MLVVYIASPLSQGGRELNIERQNEMANVLLNEGYVPFPPLLIGDMMERMQSRTWEEWIECCLAWVAKCDVVLRLEGFSHGADAEVKEAQRLNIPVVYNVDELRRIERA